MKNKFKNPYFWIGVISTFFAAAGVQLEDLVTWTVLLEKVLSILNNPFLVLTVCGALLGVFVDNSTPGLKDSKDRG